MATSAAWRAGSAETRSGRTAYRWRAASSRGRILRSAGWRGGARSPRPRRSRLRPYWSAQTTRGADAHFGLPAMRTLLSAYPQARHRLADRRPGRPWRTGGSRRGGSDPPVRGPGAGSDAGVFSHPCPRPLGSLPIHQSLRGKAVSAPLRGGGSPVRRPAGRLAAGHHRVI